MILVFDDDFGALADMVVISPTPAQGQDAPATSGANEIIYVTGRRDTSSHVGGVVDD